MNVEQIREVSKTNGRFSGTFVISRAELKPFKAKPGFFMQCDLTDRTGTVRGIVWDRAESRRELIKNKMVANVTGETARYNDAPQAVIKTISEAEDYDRSMFVPSLPEEDWARIEHDLKEVAKAITDPLYKRIWEYITTEENEVSEAFKTCPGGVGDVHHAYIGGLMEHSHSIIVTARNFMRLPQFKNMDMELLLTGALIHDIGKVKTYNWDIVIEMNDEGRLLHHVPMGVVLLNDIIWSELFPGSDSNQHNEKVVKLLHMIVSHHDSEDQGHRKPMFPEAITLARIDALDASAIHAIDFSNNDSNHEEDTNWTRFCQLTGVRYYKPLEKKEENPPESTGGKVEVTEDGAF